MSTNLFQGHDPELAPFASRLKPPFQLEFGNVLIFQTA
jgi:hypothetical protein